MTIHITFYPFVAVGTLSQPWHNGTVSWPPRASHSGLAAATPYDGGPRAAIVGGEVIVRPSTPTILVNHPCQRW